MIFILSPLATDYEPIIDNSIYWLLIKNSGVLCGLFMVHQSNGITCEVHTCVLPNHRGSKTTLYTKKLFDWIFENTQFKTGQIYDQFFLGKTYQEWTSCH